MTTKLYDYIIENVLKKYLGFGAKDFLDRQIKFHLKVEPPDNITTANLDELANWCFISSKLYLKNDALAEEIKQKLLSLKTAFKN